MCVGWQGSVATDTVHVDSIVLVQMSDCADNDTGVDSDISSDHNNHFVNNPSPFTPLHQ